MVEEDTWEREEALKFKAMDYYFCFVKNLLQLSSIQFLLLCNCEATIIIHEVLVSNFSRILAT